jgi:hypothetical protein
MQALNRADFPVIFLITGNNCSGKTTMARRLTRELPFSQSVNLGLVSKLIRFFLPEIPHEAENFDHPIPVDLFPRIVDFMVNSYYDTGVNVIIEGVQIDPQRLLDNDYAIGGAILVAPEPVLLARGEYPETHFKRKIRTLSNVVYLPNRKFAAIDNSGCFDDTFAQVVMHLETLVDSSLERLS